MQTDIEVKKIKNEEKKPDITGNNMLQNDADVVEEIKVQATPVGSAVVQEPSGSLTATQVQSTLNCQI